MAENCGENENEDKGERWRNRKITKVKQNAQRYGWQVQTNFFFFLWDFPVIIISWNFNGWRRKELVSGIGTREAITTSVCDEALKSCVKL